MHPFRLLLVAVLLTGLVATACGSPSERPAPTTGHSGPEEPSAERQGTPETPDGPTASELPGTPRPGEAAWIRQTIAGMTLREKVGQLFVHQVYGATAGDADDRNRTTYGVATPEQAIAKYHLGGVVYFPWADNIGSVRDIAALSAGLQAAAGSHGAKVPLLISVDQEQGAINRIGSPVTQFPGSMALGATRSPATARRAAAVTGRELRALGINHDYAPVADVNVDPRNPVIGTRAFGSEPGLVADLVRAQVDGFQRDAGIAATAKHFPGHGDTAVDSHTGLPVITHTRKEWERLDAPPFRAAIEAGVDAIMTGHLVFPALDPSGDPATLSRPILTGILREELGYDGVVVTDALTMQGVRERYGDDRVPVLAIKAGADLLLQPPDFETAYRSVLRAVREGEIGRDRLHQALTRILRLKWRNGIVAEPDPGPEARRSVGAAGHRAVADRAAAASTTVVADPAGLVPLPSAKRGVLVTGYSARPAFTRRLERHGFSVTAYPTGADPGSGQVGEAVRRAGRSDVVVLSTWKAWEDDHDGQRRLVAELSGAGPPVIVVALAEPQDLVYAAGADSTVATYTAQAVGMRALAKVLTGESRARGRLPVPVVASDGTPVYRYGAGAE